MTQEAGASALGELGTRVQEDALVAKQDIDDLAQQLDECRAARARELEEERRRTDDAISRLEAGTAVEALRDGATLAGLGKQLRAIPPASHLAYPSFLAGNDTIIGLCIQNAQEC